MDTYPELSAHKFSATPPHPPPHNRAIAPPPPPCLTLRPLAPEDADELRRIHATPEVARWWDAPAAGFPLSDEPDEPELTRLTIEVDGAVAGMVQFYEELDPKYRHASIDLFLDPALHGRGLGTEALRRVVRHLFDERGHHRVIIDPALANVAAVRSYEKAGFERVGVMRRYERAPEGGWRDGLLMELLAGDAQPPPPPQPLKTTGG
ncbi:MAG: GNAT family N-acetyltransferase [Actinomycetota bacterium]|nr:GNAT family N-acetyltransferase [Actinomycetota bacterium]